MRDKKLVASIRDAIISAGLKDGMTISFHHHFRDGDYVLNDVVKKISEMGYKDITVASSSLSNAHGPLVQYIKDGTITALQSSGCRGKLTIDGCTVNTGMHSLVQVTNVEKGLTITNCVVNSKNGANLNNTPSLTMSGCTFNVQGYAVRVGVSGNTNNGTFSITNSTLTSACAEAGDAVIILRGNMAGATLDLTGTTLVGTPDIIR